MKWSETLLTIFLLAFVAAPVAGAGLRRLVGNGRFWRWMRHR